MVNTDTIIDPSNDAILDTVDLGGSKLEQIAFDGRGRAFVNDEGKSVIHVFDTHSLKPLARWPLGPCEEPTGMAVDRAHHRVFAACGNEKLAVLDSDDGRVVATPAIGRDPDGALFDRRRSGYSLRTRKARSVCSGRFRPIAARPCRH
jgi:DNA-binding beta-propeller fold protein YncE